MSDTDRDGYSPFELRDMDEQTARETLTVAEYEEWEQIQDLYAQKRETEQRWEEQAETVADVTVSADMTDLGVEVELFGNTLLVYADLEDPAFRDSVETLESEFGDIEIEDPAADGAAAFGDVDADRLDDMAEHLVAMLRSVLVRWDGTPWADLSADQQDAILASVREQWGITGLLKAWGEISYAIRADYDELEARIEKFRSPERRGDR